MKILAIDPGVTTGIAFKRFGTDMCPPETQMPKGYDQAFDALDQLLNMDRNGDWDYFDLVVIERFTISSQTKGKSTQGSSTAIELIGVVRYLCWLYGFDLEEQAPVDAKTFCTDEKLKRLGWYIPGLDHQRDAMRHLLLAAVRHDQIDLTQLIPSV